MDAREVIGRQVGGHDAITTRIGAVALPLGILVILVSEYFHPSREDPMANPAVFMQYAHSDIWTAVHLAEYFGFLLLLGGHTPARGKPSAGLARGWKGPESGLLARIAVKLRSKDEQGQEKRTCSKSKTPRFAGLLRARSAGLEPATF